MSQRKNSNQRQLAKDRAHKKSFDEITKRRTGTIDLATRILIVCEDEKSAVNYFNALIKQMGLSSISPKVFPNDNGETQPDQVIQYAKELKQKARKSGTEKYDEIWCVIDGDFGGKVTNSRQTARHSNIKLAISTPCFEFWVLLHYEDRGEFELKCDGMVSQLRKHLKMYKKGTWNFEETVKAVPDAYARAKQQRNAETPFAEDQNPCSDLYILIEKLFLAWRDSYLKNKEETDLTTIQTDLYARMEKLIPGFAQSTPSRVKRSHHGKK